MRALRSLFSRWFPTLAAQLSAIGIVAFTMLAAILVLVFRYSWITAQIDATTEGLHSIASDIATEVQPFLDPVVDESNLNRSMHTFLLYNRSIDIYIVDADGAVSNSFCSDGCAPHVARVDRGPLSASSGGSMAVTTGADPRRVDTLARISIAPVSVAGSRQFVYVVLFNRNALHLTHILQGPVALRMVVPLVALITFLISILFRISVRRFMQPLDGIMNAVHSIRRGEYDVSIPAGRAGELALLGTAIREMAGTISGNIITLRENDRTRRELISNIWHDIRTPVTGISSLLQRYERHQSAQSGEGRDFTSRMRANVELLTRFLSDISELGKLETGEIRPKLERCGVVTMLEDVAIVFAAITEERQITLTIAADENIPAVRADSTMITRVVSNLVQNAIRYTPEHGSIVIGAEQEDGAVSLFVRDTGSGIGPDELPRIFERTFQSASEVEHGTGGLGLAIVKSIVESHGSSIKVASTLGAGTEFRFSLPISEPLSSPA